MGSDILESVCIVLLGLSPLGIIGVVMYVE